MEFPLIAFATLVSAMIVAGAFTGLVKSERAREDLAARWRAWSDRHAWRFEAQRGARNDLPLPRVRATVDGALVTVELRDRGPSRVVHLGARAPASAPALVLCDRALAPPAGLAPCALDDRAFEPPLDRVDEAVRIVASLAARAGAAYR